MRSLDGFSGIRMSEIEEEHGLRKGALVSIKENVPALSVKAGTVGEVIFVQGSGTSIAALAQIIAVQVRISPGRPDMWFTPDELKVISPNTGLT